MPLSRPSARRFPSQPNLLAQLTTNSDSLRFRSLAAGRVTDGESLFVPNVECRCHGKTPAIPLPPQAGDPEGATRCWRFRHLSANRSFSEPDQDPAWQSQNWITLSPSALPCRSRTCCSNAPDFPGGHLDWYSFDLDKSAAKSMFRGKPRADHSCRFQLPS